MKLTKEKEIMKWINELTEKSEKWDALYKEFGDELFYYAKLGYQNNKTVERLKKRIEYLKTLRSHPTCENHHPTIKELQKILEGEK